ncbi:MAG: hypothetical protein H0U12_12465 [Thermoleophilaceae bacterium]|nr:hypothetical protein [Thermoleophilaceae bacterium]
MGKRSLVEVPPGAEPPYLVFVNGVRQAEGSDYRVKDRKLLFDRELVQEGRLGFWRWTLMFFSIAGTYRRDDSVDVKYRRDGRERVATGLDIVTLEEPVAPPADRAGERDFA